MNRAPRARNRKGPLAAAKLKNAMASHFPAFVHHQSFFYDEFSYSHRVNLPPLESAIH
jgi:hypothetical protein